MYYIKNRLKNEWDNRCRGSVGDRSRLQIYLYFVLAVMLLFIVLIEAQKLPASVQIVCKLACMISRYSFKSKKWNQSATT